MELTSVAAVEEALALFNNRISTRTGRTISKSYQVLARTSLTDKVKQVIASGLRGDALMLAIDIALDGEKPSKRGLGMRVLAMFCEYFQLIDAGVALKWKRIGGKRCVPRRSPKEKVLLPNELSALFGVIAAQGEKSIAYARLHVWVSLLLLTGARREEITPLKYSDLSLTEQTLTIRLMRKKTLTDSPDYIEIPLATMLPSGVAFGDALMQYLHMHPGSGYLFATNADATEYPYWLARYLASLLTRSAELAGLGHRNISAHSLRYTCATIVSDYVGTRQAQRLLGHSSVLTTERYAGHYYSNDTAKVIGKAFSNFSW